MGYNSGHYVYLAPLKCNASEQHTNYAKTKVMFRSMNIDQLSTNTDAVNSDHYVYLATLVQSIRAADLLCSDQICVP